MEYDISTSLPPLHFASILQPSKLASHIAKGPFTTSVETPTSYVFVEGFYVRFHEKPKPSSLSARQTRLQSAPSFDHGHHRIRFRQMRITPYFKSDDNGHSQASPSQDVC